MKTREHIALPDIVTGKLARSRLFSGELKFERIGQPDGSRSPQFTKAEQEAIKAEEAKFAERRPYVTVLDVSEGWDTQAQVEIVLAHLKEIGIYDEDLIYQPSNAESIPTTLEYGNDEGQKDIVDFCCSEAGLLGNDHSLNPYTAALYSYQHPALVIYNRRMLENLEERSRYLYRAQPGTTLKEALVAIIALTSKDFGRLTW